MDNSTTQSQMQQSVTDPLAKKATTSLVLGIIGLVAWVFPLIGLPVTIAGLVFGIKGWKSTKHTLAVAGVVLSIVGLIFTIVNMSIGAYMGATGQHPLVNEVLQ
jgi:hypothetical protein